MMKHVFTIVAAVILSWMTTERLQAQSGRELLEQAFEVSRASSFQAAMRNPFRPAKTDKEILPYAEKWVFYRLAADGQIYLRLDSFVPGRTAKDRLIESYVKNESGTYGRAADGFAAEIVDVPLLWYPELIFMPIDPQEFALAEVDVSTTTHGDIPCYKVVVRVPADDGALMRITGESRAQFQAHRDRYRSRREFTYEFVIGRQDSLIYERRHYNLNGKLIFAMSLGTVDATAPNRALFQTPPHLKGCFIKRNFFASRVLEKMLERQTPSWADRLGAWCGNIFWRSTGALTWLAGILGGGILIFLLLAKKFGAGSGRKRS